MPDIGETLRETRMRRRIDMTEVEAATKIRAKYLRALENEEWDLLPGPTFVKTFLRTYAEYLELDPRLLVEEYKQRYERPSTQDLTPFGAGRSSGRGGPQRGRRRRRRSRSRSGPLVLLVLLVIVGVAYGLDTLLAGGSGSPDHAATPTVTPLAPSPTATPARTHKKKRKKKAVPARVELKVLPTQPVFVCVQDATGKTLVNANLDTGKATKTFRSQRFRMSFSNANARMLSGKHRYAVANTGKPIGYELVAGKKPRKLAESTRVKLCG